jgi:hypothetical protein
MRIRPYLGGIPSVMRIVLGFCPTDTLLSCTDAVAFPYIALILSTKHKLTPNIGNICYRY